MITKTIENQPILKAIAQIEFTENGVPFNRVRETVSQEGVRWAKESLLGIPSKPGKIRLEITLESKSALSLKIARSELEKYASVESFSFETDRAPDRMAMIRKPSFRTRR